MIRRSARLAGKKRTENKELKVDLSQEDIKPKKNIKVKKEEKFQNGEQSFKREPSVGDNEFKIKIKKEEDPPDEKRDVMRSNEIYVGCHTSISGGVWKAVEEATSMGARAFGLFLRNQQQWKVKPLMEGHAERFKAACKEHGFSRDVIVPHGSYLMNCGSSKEEVREKSRNMLVEELKRCEELGLLYFNFHPGSTLGKMPVPTCLAHIADAINNAHDATAYAVTLLENMSCQGNTVGGKLQELRDIIDMVNDKTRIGVCIDTCHAHAAGYDLSTQKGFEALMRDLEEIVGLRYLKAMHINDSKGESGCRLDRHENIGKGTIGLSGFTRIMNDPRLCGIPMILETPYKPDIYKEEIKLLYSLKS